MIGNDNKNPFRDRAGEYVVQPGGYQAFIPKPLPPEPSIQLDNPMLQLLSLADQALGRLDGASEILPNADLFVAMYVRKEAVLSSQIEGTQASLIDVLAFESDAAEPENPQDVEEVVNYVYAMNYGLDRLKTLPLSLRLMKEIHERLLAGVRGSDRHPGEFRTFQNWIGHQGCTIETARFVPPPVTEMLNTLYDLERFIHSAMPLPILLKVGLVHAQFETAHPFLDGNGRMGRLLITFILCQHNVLRQPLLYLSHFFKLNKSEYYEYLQRVRDEGDWEAWLKFFLQGVYEVAQEATNTARSILQLRERHLAIIAHSFSRTAGSAYKLLEHLYKRPIITIHGAAEITGQSYANANKLVQRFQEYGILHEMARQQRHRRFSYNDYLDLFADEEIPHPMQENRHPNIPDITQSAL